MGIAAICHYCLRGDRNHLNVKLLVVLLALFQSGCGSLINWDAGRASGVTVEEGGTSYYIVSKGDTLYSIAFQVGRDYREIARWNGIRWPYRIFPDQRLRLTPPVVTARRTTRTPQTGSPSSPSRSSAAAQRPQRTRTPSTVGAALAWQWPTEGTILKTFSHSESGRKGLDVGGRRGQPVRAAAPGRVVYSGSGLRGYGQLIIVKHNSVYLSAYGHNQRLLVKEGETLRAGQLIAEMGDSEATQPMLHFEIRRNGEPVDPQSLLPKR